MKILKLSLLLVAGVALAGINAYSITKNEAGTKQPTETVKSVITTNPEVKAAVEELKNQYVSQARINRMIKVMVKNGATADDVRNTLDRTNERIKEGYDPNMAVSYTTKAVADKSFQHKAGNEISPAPEANSEAKTEVSDIEDKVIAEKLDEKDLSSGIKQTSKEIAGNIESKSPNEIDNENDNVSSIEQERKDAKEIEKDAKEIEKETGSDTGND